MPVWASIPIVARPAIEQNENDRAAYQLRIGIHYEPEQLVFVDKSAFDRRVSRRPYGWAPTGNRARRRDFFIRGKRCTICELFHFSQLIFHDTDTQYYQHCHCME
jgi:hypothetical protein